MRDTVITFASEAGSEGGISPIAVGGLALLILLILLIAVVAFGGGRDHS